MTSPDSLDLILLPSILEGELWRRSPQDVPGKPRLHRHLELEFNLVTAGHASYLLHDRHSETTRRYQMRRGTLIFLHPELEHMLIDPSADFAMWIGVTMPDLTARIAATLPGGDALRSPHPPAKVGAWLDESDTRRLEALLTDADRLENRYTPDFDAGVFNAAMGYILARAWSLYRTSEELPTHSMIHPAVAEAARLLRDEASALPMRELAKRVGISPSHLSIIFHRQTGETIATYRNRQRMERFLSQESSPGTLLERALEAGFGSYAQFHRVYRSAIGQAPSVRSERRRVTPE